MKRITLTLPAPYVGLRPFEEKDALLFFGREAHVRDLLAKLEHQQRFIAVIGASGSGKSSLVRAGLIPALHRGALASAGYRWNVHITKPGDAPLHNLVEKLTEDQRWIDGDDRTASMASLRAQFAINPLALVEQYQRRAALFNVEALLLVVDQFEEIFRYRQQNVDEAEAFIKLLLRSVSESGQVPVYVVITMRSDFLGNCVTFFGLPEAINSGLYLTPRLRPEQLKSIIASPLALIGSDIDPVLVNRLINTLEGGDELPVLEHALLRMWNHAKDKGRNRIEAQDFAVICKPPATNEGEAMPKLAFAIDNHASEIYNQLTPQQQAIARQVFPALVERRESRDVRRPQTLQQLIELTGDSNRDSVLTVINAYRKEGAGFLLPPATETITEETLIDISHESLFRQWHLYKKWLDEEALDAAELKEWHYRLERHQQTGSGWLDENDSHRALQWLERMNKYYVPQQWVTRYLGQHDFQSIKTFIENSHRIVQKKQQAETERLEAEAALQRQLAEHAEKEKLQAEAFAKSSRIKSYWAIGAALVAILFSVISFGFWQHAEQERIRADGEKDHATQAKNHAEKLARSGHANALISTAENLKLVTPDQSILLGLAAWKIDNSAKVESHLLSVFTAYTFQASLRGHNYEINDAQFSPDGKTILTSSRDKTARLWDTVSGKLMYVLQGNDAGVSAQFSPDGKTVLTYSSKNRGHVKTTRLWNASSGQLLYVLNGGEEHFWDVQFFPDGKTVLVSSKDNTVHLWDATSGNLLNVLQGHKKNVSGVKLSPDGKTILTWSGHETARLWDAVSGKPLHVLQDHEGFFEDAQFSPDGKLALIWNYDKIFYWDVASGKPLHVMQDHEKKNHQRIVLGAQFFLDGGTILTWSFENIARLWSCDVCRPIEEIAAELKRRVGRDLTDEERRRFGVADIIAQEQ
ncbi:MAG: WD40 repeat domain-containing protein [Gammaproteobacteria bacterium]|nr:MAG: WD40 repeat domain-containing protein [Gammaproteobacteria bacterium]